MNVRKYNTNCTDNNKEYFFVKNLCKEYFIKILGQLSSRNLCLIQRIVQKYWGRKLEELINIALSSKGVYVYPFDFSNKIHPIHWTLLSGLRNKFSSVRNFFK